MWGGIFGSGREGFSLQEFESAHQTLDTCPRVAEYNAATIIQALKDVAEIVVWADQNDPRVFDYFIEWKTLEVIERLSRQSFCRRGTVGWQLLQTLNIWVQSFNSKTNLYYLFSNNHLNQIIKKVYDTDDEEILNLYMSLLKGLSLRLDGETVQFFYLVQDEFPYTVEFPLYTEAIKFSAHKDSQIRTAVRTLTLNVYRLKDEKVQNFVISPPAVKYFDDLTSHLLELCQRLKFQIGYAMKKIELLHANSSTVNVLNNLFGELEDILLYFSDILNNPVNSGLYSTFSEVLWSKFICQQIIWPLVGQDTEQSQIVCALMVCERIFNLLSCAPFQNALAATLLAGNKWQNRCLRPLLKSGLVPKPNPSVPTISRTATQHRRSLSDGQPSQIVLENLYVRIREALLSQLSSKVLVVSTMAVRLIIAMVQCQQLEAVVAGCLGLIESKQKRRQQLLRLVLGSGYQDDDAVDVANNELTEQSAAAESSFDLPDQSVPLSDSCGLVPRTETPNPDLEMPSETESYDGDELEHEHIDYQRDNQLTDAIFQFIQQKNIPVISLCHAAWLLNELSRSNQEEDKDYFSQEQIKDIDKLLIKARRNFENELNGVWCDGLHAMVCIEWSLILKNIDQADVSSINGLVSEFTAGIICRHFWDRYLNLESQENGKVRHLMRTELVGFGTVQAVQRYIATFLTKQLLIDGNLVRQCPIEDRVNLSKLRKRTEFNVVQLNEIVLREKCLVAFREQEQLNVLFSMGGFPKDLMERVTGGDEDYLIDIVNREPVCLLLEQGNPHQGIAVVKAHTPLLGSCAFQDDAHPKWLHVKTRSRLCDMLRVMDRPHLYEQDLAMNLKDLFEGFWVLSFMRSANTSHVKDQLDLYTGKLRALYVNVLDALLN